jgi:hypothetical protein
LTALRRSEFPALLHDRMTESVLPGFDAARELFRHFAPKPLATVDVLAAAKNALVDANTARWAWRCPTTRSITWSRTSRQGRPQPDRRRADDVRPGQFRTLPPQDFQRLVGDRRRGQGR